jgi:RNA polymerase sigma-70 factor (sigma-E family)
MDEARRAAFDALVRTRSAALLRTAYLMTGDWAKAEDLLQTAFAKTYVRWDALRDVGAGEAYVRRVLATTYAKWWRRRSYHAEVLTGATHEVELADHADAALLRQTVAGALAALPPALRVVVVLRFFDDLSEAQVADLLGIPLGTVKSRTSRALAALRGRGLLDDDALRVTAPCEGLA